MTFGEKVRYCRKKKGLSILAVAEHLDIHRSNISKVENDVHKLSTENTHKFAQLVEVPVEFFFDDNAVAVEEITNNNKLLAMFNSPKSIGYMVLADKAEKNNITEEELENAINFLIQIKKNQPSN